MSADDTPPPASLTDALPALPAPLSGLLARPLPEPFKAAAGLAVVAIDEARSLPQRLASLPVTAASQAMQTSMRIQQRYAELVAKGDTVISALRGEQDAPPWATFDEDAGRPGATGDTVLETVVGGDLADRPPLAEPVPQEESLAARGVSSGVGPGSAFDREPADQEAPARRRRRKATAPTTNVSAAPVDGYDEFTLPQLRARVKGYSAVQLEELLTYETANSDRAPYVAMLTKRLDAVRP